MSPEIRADYSAGQLPPSQPEYQSGFIADYLEGARQSYGPDSGIYERCVFLAKALEHLGYSDPELNRARSSAAHRATLGRTALI